MSLEKKVCLILLFSLLFSLCACTVVPPRENQSTNPAAQNKANSFPLQITDFLSREVVIKKVPERIVSLSPSSTEILFALGIGDRLVGVTNYDDYPPEVKELPKVSDFKGANLEAILRQKPDLIFASNLSGKDEMEAIEKMGFPVVMLQATSLNQIADSIKIMAQITGTEKAGQKLIDDMQHQLDELTVRLKDVPRIKVFYLVDSNGNWTTGKGTFIHELITLAGGENIAGNLEGWIQYSLEKIVEENPSVIITAPHAAHGENVVGLPGLKQTHAVKEGRIYMVSDDNIITRPSHRITEGLAEIAKFLHPEAFK